MSRGFVKEEDQEEAPIIPPRAALPAGVANYVTPEGLQALLDEKAELEMAKSQNKQENDAARRYENLMIEGKLKLLIERINSAKVVESSGNMDEARFGSTVTLKTISGLKPGMVRKFKIVGVDEADVKKNKIAFTAPIAKAVIGKRLNEKLEFQIGNTVEKLELLDLA
ncbi:GreA/GreB family elongation factor [Litoribacter ruber]|uniref:GreA/GreB family elongation factor n=1 Tax=Litoribacter ruber TaxID=702568 RepID=A0AAP2G423_9BACT|nr:MULTISPECIES: GreA/GreB family elongation factor [Litoribacter]MBS9523028.1 GreA/GreB family elongation factor [Litoribacter alkaliphilus]MBT0810808.1 GreA/GreB family elongation factor [Litoribacter ruber]